ncbi:NADPH-dependent L-lysine 6-monooxygenase-like protein [Salsuginibacillus halophilus]|uniref:NADPH-dependent L-lysine 6-monooxygenase-like protein n=1 Tax=Salsuginibacillus halophilus TaxID=517424 RepID=A0A2P8HQK1_9BACI|nr:FAD/NAD(P)-binding protein [Salsuginibacillus halophilus]PSL48488.1 NADPH-dependent L-lysine 6-monooxygenase-like protein [Salsuginibacillus halophilus]
MVEWLIIGGGIHGSTMFTHLRKMLGVKASQIAWVDPAEEPLAVWKRCTSAVHMTDLRSPGVHHIDTTPFSFIHYAKENRHLFERAPFSGHYKHPSLEAFDMHADATLEDLNWRESWVQGNVVKLQRTSENGWFVLLNSKHGIHARQVILAIGASEAPNIPNFLKPDRASGCYHVFSQEMPSIPKLTGQVAVIGGGITGAQAALAASQGSAAHVTLASGKDLQIQRFDSDPGWLGPKYMKAFNKEKDTTVRRDILTKARHRGSMPRKFYQMLKQHIKDGRITLSEQRVTNASQTQSWQLELADGEALEADHLLLATGFQQKMPGKSWLQPLIDDCDLSTAPCGYPIVDSENLAWHQGLYVMGPLAELELGPVSRNIAGAQRAARRICASQPALVHAE